MRAAAKLNLSLAVLARRDDGFHEIIVAQGVSLLSLELDVHGFALLDELE